MALRTPLVQALSISDRSDLILILSEVVSNAVAAAPTDSPIAIDLSRRGTTVIAEVSNVGESQVPLPVGAMDLGQPCGRGLAIVESLGGVISSFITPGHTTVRVVLIPPDS